MRHRWVILALLFIVRTAMGFQYQSVGSVSSPLIDSMGIDYIRLGFLISLYDLPGIFLAFPGGLLGTRFGDKRVVAAGLGLMTTGGLIMGAGGSYAPVAVGRLLAGVGAILLNVLLTKMVADWFAGREIVMAMAILVSSWPLGISLALVSLGPLAAVSSWVWVMRLTAVVCAAALALVVTLYRTPPVSGADPATIRIEARLSPRELGLVALAGCVWTVFNAGFLCLPSFGADVLASSGYTIGAASLLVSVPTWVVIPALPLGGYLAERLRRPNLIVVASCLAVALALCTLPYWPYRLVSCIALGVLFGLAPGIILALPAEVLRPENRASGMGVFYTCNYAGAVPLFALAGLTRDVTQSPAAPLLFGGGLFVIVVLIYGLFRMFQARNFDIPSTRSSGLLD